MPLGARQGAVCDEARMSFPVARVEIPLDAEAGRERRDHLSAVGEEAAPARSVGSGERRPDQLPGRDVPEPEVAVAAGGGELGAVGAERDADHGPVLPAERATGLSAGPGVPEVDVARD